MNRTRQNQSAPSSEKTTSTRTAFCAACPDPQEVEQLLQIFGFHLVFSMPADTAGTYQHDLPPLPAQYHFEDAVGTRVEYLAGVDTPCLDEDEDDASASLSLCFPLHASRFWLTPGGQELTARRVQEQLTQRWLLRWLIPQLASPVEEVA